MPYIIAALFLFLIALLLFNTIRLSGYPEDVSPVEIPRLDKEKISRHLSQIIQFESISKEGSSGENAKAFADIHNWIEKTYPLIKKNLEKTTINKSSLLYKWQGTDPALAPVLFNAHQDVVPVDEKTLKSWNVKPFSGTIKGGYIWGRGAIDMKGQLVGLLDAVEELLQEEFSPRRTIYLAFGHDEEIMGFQGSMKIVDHLKVRGVKLAALLDEGGFITSGALPGVDEPFGLIGVSEKGYLTLKLSAVGSPGHSSQPPRQTAVGIISRAIALLDDQPMKPNLDYLLPTLKSLGYLLPFGLRFVIANAWLFKGLLIKRLSKSPQLNAMIRTTHAATIINGGIKDNVLPSAAEAKVNFRLLPGDTIEDVIAHVTKVIADPRVEVKIDEQNGGWGASNVSPVTTPAYLSLELVTRQVFQNVSMAPFVFLAATDSRHYQSICSNIFKFSPLMLSSDEQHGMHGINERINQESLVGMVAFYTRIMRVWGEAEF